jgi:hypothetical protein
MQPRDEREGAVSTPLTKEWTLHTPNSIVGGSEVGSEDRARSAGSDSTTQLSRSLPDNLSEVRKLIEE